MTEDARLNEFMLSETGELRNPNSTFQVGRQSLRQILGMDREQGDDALKCTLFRALYSHYTFYTLDYRFHVPSLYSRRGLNDV